MMETAERNAIMDTLQSLQKCMFDHYAAYRNGKMSQQEYLFKIKPIDGQIEKIELSILKQFRCDAQIGS